MNDAPISSDDPRLTAYVLGELDPSLLSAVETALRLDPAVRLAVAEIRAATEALTAMFAAEDVSAAAPPGAGDAAILSFCRPVARRARRFSYLTLGAAAAGLILTGWWERTRTKTEPLTRITSVQAIAPLDQPSVAVGAPHLSSTGSLLPKSPSGPMRPPPDAIIQALESDAPDVKFATLNEPLDVDHGFEPWFTLRSAGSGAIAPKMPLTTIASGSLAQLKFSKPLAMDASATITRSAPTAFPVKRTSSSAWFWLQAPAMAPIRGLDMETIPSGAISPAPPGVDLLKDLSLEPDLRRSVGGWLPVAENPTSVGPQFFSQVALNALRPGNPILFVLSGSGIVNSDSVPTTPGMHGTAYYYVPDRKFVIPMAPVDFDRGFVISPIPLSNDHSAPSGVVIAIEKDGTLALNGIVLSPNELVHALAPMRKDTPINVRAAEDVPFKSVSRILDLCRAFGFSAVNLQAL
jgi:hypothetical protein